MFSLSKLCTALSSDFKFDLFSQASATGKNSYSQFTFREVKSMVCAHNALQQQPVDKRKRRSICWLVFGLSPELCVGWFLALCGCLSGFLLVCTSVMWLTKFLRLLLRSSPTVSITEGYGITGTMKSCWHARKGKPCQKRKLSMMY